MTEKGGVTEALQAWCQGDQGAVERLFPLVYDHLRSRAAAILRSERPDHTLTAAALVNEAYLRLVDSRLPYFESRKHFYGVAVRVMRQVLVDYARARNAGKRNLGAVLLDLKDALCATSERSQDLVALDDALQALADFDPEKARVVELRFFTGLTIKETAEILAISSATVKREWALARAWLNEQMAGRL